MARTTPPGIPGGLDRGGAIGRRGRLEVDDVRVRAERRPIRSEAKGQAGLAGKAKPRPGLMGVVVQPRGGEGDGAAEDPLRGLLLLASEAASGSGGLRGRGGLGPVVGMRRRPRRVFSWNRLRRMGAPGEGPRDPPTSLQGPPRPLLGVGWVFNEWS